MKADAATRQRRVERKAKRRAHRLKTGRRPRALVIDVDAAEQNLDAMMGPIRKQSRKRQKKLDKARQQRVTSRINSGVPMPEPRMPIKKRPRAGHYPPPGGRGTKPGR